MKSHGVWLVGSVILGVALSGCGKSGGQPAGAGSAAGQADSADPAATVSQFLDAIRTGNDEHAMGLLTAVARQKAVESGRSPTPPASDTAKFEVGEVTTVGDDIARVNCTWTDLDESGKPRTDRAIWVCRREAEGWRVGGVAAVVFEGEDPLLLDFEKPDEMTQKQEWLREEIARRENRQTEKSSKDGGKILEDPMRR
ncbi:MAG: hypothetical protein ABR915_05425 [Thermoguttaceae bacterium]|jgi:hypothetical protein